MGSTGQAVAPTTPLPQEAWDGAVERLAKKILQEQSPRMAMEVRGGLYELLAAGLPPDFILKQLLFKLIAGQSNDELKRKAIAAAAHFESTMRAGSKDSSTSRHSCSASWPISRLARASLATSGHCNLDVLGDFV